MTSPEHELRVQAETEHARAVAELFAEPIPARPADLLSPDRRRAIRERRCHCLPIGCGLPVREEDFRDAVEAREYRLSALCPSCQRALFDGFADAEAEAEAEQVALREEPSSGT